jgi:hypothetical protein
MKLTDTHTMSYATRALRREVEETEHPIGLGWLLAIALCGGILLFAAIGLLLVWWIKKNRLPGPRMVYGYSATHNSLMPPSSSRLVKRRLLSSESFTKDNTRMLYSRRCRHTRAFNCLSGEERYREAGRGRGVGLTRMTYMGRRW